MKNPSVRIVGDNSQAGTYILRIRLQTDTTLQFGRFRDGKRVSLPVGDCVYVGSALSEKGATSLVRRLVRHATRSAGRPPHAIRETMLYTFARCRLGTGDLLPRRGKTLYWNVDFLLDLQSAALINVLAIRSVVRWEHRIAEWLANDPGTAIIEPGLGANDTKGATHLLRAPADAVWWLSFTDEVTNLLSKCPLDLTKNREAQQIISEIETRFRNS